MHTTTDHRSLQDAAFEPQGDGWMYRSEAFAEDVDHLLPAAQASAAPRQLATSALESPRQSARWPAMLAGALRGRVLRAG